MPKLSYIYPALAYISSGFGLLIVINGIYGGLIGIILVIVAVLGIALQFIYTVNIGKKKRTGFAKFMEVVSVMDAIAMIVFVSYAAYGLATQLQ